MPNGKGVPTTVSPSDAGPKDYVIQRDGDRDLVFEGWLVGYAEESSGLRKPNARGVQVSIFGTSQENLILQVCRWRTITALSTTSSSSDVLVGYDETYSTGVFVPSEKYGEVGIEGALNWLRKDAGGKLGPTSKTAWLQACENWNVLEGEGLERV